jgi:dihydroorotate dehydrogenase
MSYALLRPALFALAPETAHHLTLRSLRALNRLGLIRAQPSTSAACARTVMGLTFPNPVGLAAGLDKNGEYIDALAALGFGFIEIGTVTPRPQPGNPPPRLFRLPEASALINRLGFNNQGVDRLVENVRRSSWRGVLAINIGKNFDTPVERAADDYLACLRRVYALASYVTVNISSPNTKGLRSLQEAAQLDALLAALSAERNALAAVHGKRVPLALKIAPDLELGQVATMAELLRKHRFDAVIATNTTVNRNTVTGLPHANEAGGLSGAPLTTKSTTIVAQLARELGPAVPVIGVGGIMRAADATAKIAAGASLVQLYTGLIYAGPRLVQDCVDALCQAAAEPSNVATRARLESEPQRGTP